MKKHLKKIGRSLGHRVEFFLFLLIYGLLRTLPLSLSKKMARGLLKTIGPKTGAHKVGLKNLAAAFPALSKEKHEAILKGAWGNLGNVVGEFPRVPELINEDRYETQGLEALEPLIQERGGIFFSAHLGNWEISYAPLAQKGYHINLIARVHRNALLNAFMEKNRSTPTVRMISRNHHGNRALIAAIRNKELIGALVDQYATDGTFIDFMGRPAKTTLALARMALHYNIPLIPVQVIRKEGSLFRVIFHPPLQKNENLKEEAQPEDLMKKANQMIASWIHEHPSEWLWQHNRWKVKSKK